MKRLACVVAVAALSACGGSAPDNGATAEGSADGASAAAQASVPRFTEVTIPAGTTIRVELTSSVASDTSTVEQPVNAELATAVSINGKVALPAGSQVTGVVTEVERSGRVKGLGHVAYRFDSVRAGGENYPITTAPISHTAEPTKGDDAKKVGIGAGAGAAVGALLGGAKGAAKGAAAGAAGGASVVLATRGEEVRVGPGTAITVRLTAPVTVRVRL